MDRVLTLALLVLAGCGEKEPIAFQEVKSPPPGMKHRWIALRRLKTQCFSKSTENIATSKNLQAKQLNMSLQQV